MSTDSTGDPQATGVADQFTEHVLLVCGLHVLGHFCETLDSEEAEQVFDRIRSVRTRLTEEAAALVGNDQGKADALLKELQENEAYLEFISKTMDCEYVSAMFGIAMLAAKGSVMVGSTSGLAEFVASMLRDDEPDKPILH